MDIATELDELSATWHELNKRRPTGASDSIQKTWYQLSKLCDLPWTQILTHGNVSGYEFSLPDSLIVCAPNAGPIAVMKLKEAFLSGGGHVLIDHIAVFSSCGYIVSKVPWKEKKDVVRLEFTQAETLAIVTADCWVFLLKPREDEPAVKCLAPELENATIEGAKVHGNSLILICSSKKIYLIKDLNTCLPQIFCDAYQPLKTIVAERILEIAVLEPESSASGRVEVLFPRSHHDGGGLHWIAEEVHAPEPLLALGTITTTTSAYTIGKVLKLTLRPSEEKPRLLAILSEESLVLLDLSDPEHKKWARVEMSSGTPDDIVWCGTERLALAYYPNQIVLIGAMNQEVVIEIPKAKSPTEGFFCCSELDGMRVFTNTECYFLEEVPEAMQKVLEPEAGDEVAVQLLGAYKKMLRRTGMAHSQSPADMIKGVKEESEPKTKEGIETLIDAAAHMYDPRYQKFILKAALFCKSFVGAEMFDNEGYMETLKNLRILNQLRKPQYGRLMTYKEFLTFKPKELVTLLMSYRQHLLAVEVCKAHNKEEMIGKVLEDWAVQRLKHGGDSKTDPYLDIVQTLSMYPSNVSYKPIILAAITANRKDIANKFLKNVCSLQDQMEILVALGEQHMALGMAIADCDTDAIYTIISTMRGAGNSMAEIVQAFGRTGVDCALDYLISYGHQKLVLNPGDETLSQILACKDTIIGSKKDAISKTTAEKMQLLEEYNAVEEVFRSKDIKVQYQLLCKLIKTPPKGMRPEAKSLVTTQLKFIERKSGASSVPKKDPSDVFLRSGSLFKGLAALVAKKEGPAEADAAAKEFGVNIKHYHVIKLRAVAKAGDWANFIHIINKEKAKVTAEVCAETCLEFRNSELAIEYIAKVKEPERKVGLYLEAGRHKDAIEAAVGADDQEGLLNVIRSSSKINLEPMIQEAIAKPRPKKSFF